MRPIPVAAPLAGTLLAPFNSTEPVPGDFVAHGRFDDEARSSLDPVRMGNVRVAAAGIGTAILAGMAAAAYASGRRTAEHSHREVLS